MTVSTMLKTATDFMLVLYYWLEGIVLALIPRKLMFKDINGEIVLITGAGSGIGRLMALKFARKGAILVLWDVDEKSNEETASLIKKEGGKATSYKVDITDREAVYKSAAKVKAEVGVVTIVVNNAGIVIGNSILELSDKAIEKVFQVNALAHFWVIKAFLPEMIVKNHGHLVTISSLAGIGGMPKLTDYCASKFAALGLMESIQIELHSQGHDNIHTTTVCPYFINTGMFDGACARFAILEPEYVAEEVLAAVLCNQQIKFIPRMFYVLHTMKTLMPSRALTALQDACGGSTSMETFMGRKAKAKIQ